MLFTAILLCIKLEADSGSLCTQPAVFGGGFTERLAYRSRWRWSQIFCRGNTGGLGGSELQHKLQHVSQRILRRARAIISVAVEKHRAQLEQDLFPESEEVFESHPRVIYHSSFCWRVASCSLTFFTSPLLSWVCCMFLWRYLSRKNKAIPETAQCTCLRRFIVYWQLRQQKVQSWWKMYPFTWRRFISTC